MNASELKDEIQTAFAGVTLGKGVSLRQAEVMDNYGESLSKEDFERLQKYGCTDDWRRVELGEWVLPNITYLDALGYRYYIPAYMCSLIDNPAPGDLFEICTLQTMFAEGEQKDYRLAKFGELNDIQKRAIGLFLIWHMDQPDTFPEDRALAQRAIADYWQAYLDPPMPNQSTDPTSASGTSPAGQESRHP